MGAAMVMFGASVLNFYELASIGAVDNRAGCPRHVRFTKPQRGPSYVAVMSNMTDAADGFPSTTRSLFILLLA